MVKLLLEPKSEIPNKYKNKKIFFLAGPIRGGNNWQIKAAEFLWKKYPGCIVVDPTRWELAEEIAKSFKLKKRIFNHRKNSIGIKNEKLYPNQASWESNYMKKASIKGCLIFWLEKESRSEPRPKTSGVYAQDTRVEIGMWIEKINNNSKLKVKIGGCWEIDKNGYETSNSFGGMNFITYYLTGEKDRRKIYQDQIKNPHLVLAKDIEEFLEKAFL